jgi:hypothetical protein
MARDLFIENLEVKLLEIIPEFREISHFVRSDKSDFNQGCTSRELVQTRPAASLQAR